MGGIHQLTPPKTKRHIQTDLNNNHPHTLQIEAALMELILTILIHQEATNRSRNESSTMSQNL